MNLPDLRRARSFTNGCLAHPVAALGWTGSWLSLIVAMTIIVMIGPSLQFYLLALLKSDAASIYESAYSDSLIVFPTLNEWLLNTVNWPYLLIALIGVPVSVRSGRSRDVLIAGSLIFPCLLFILDVLLALFIGELTLAYAFENVIADVIGGFMISLLLVSLLAASRLCFEHIELPDMLRRIIVAVMVVFAAVIISCGAYYVARLFYSPLPAKVDLTLGSPTSGVLGRAAASEADSLRQDESESKKAAFQFFPTQIDNASISWRGGVTENDKLTIRWERRSSDSGKYEIALQVANDCAPERIESLGLSSNGLSTSNIQRFSISFQGDGDIGTLPGRSITSEFKLRNDEISMFWIDKGNEANSTKLTQFLSKESEVEFKSQDEQLGIYVNLPLFEAGNANIASTARFINVSIDDTDYVFKVRASKDGTEPKPKSQCKLASKQPDLSKNQLIFDGAKASASLILRIKRRPPSGKSSQGEASSRLTLSGLNGWMTVELPEAPAANSLGNVDLMSFKGNVSNFDIDGKAIQAKPIDQYTAFGLFEGKYEAERSLRLTGSAKAFWKNGVRQNLTKWEKLTWDQQLKIVAAILAIFGPSAAFVIAQVRKNGPVAIEYRLPFM